MGEPTALGEPAAAGLRRWWHSRFGAPFARELVIVLGLFAFYKYGRTLVRDESVAAIQHARELIRFERDLKIFTEARLQEVALGAGTTVEWFLNAYYLVAHVAVTAIAFVWLYARHPNTYVRFRRVMIVMTFIGLAIHLLYPLAPPRMFPHLGFVDTGRLVGPASYGRGSAYEGFANQFAAMPSLHFGFALAVAWATILASSRRVRYVILAHPALTLAAIVLTANHYWLDAIVAAFLFVLALLFDRARLRRAPPRGSAPRPEPAWDRVSPARPIRT
jgi:hypothetical protein